MDGLSEQLFQVHQPPLLRHSCEDVLGLVSSPPWAHQRALGQPKQALHFADFAARWAWTPAAAAALAEPKPEPGADPAAEA